MLYLARNELNLDPNEFDFSVRGRANTPLKRPSNTSKPKPKRIRIRSKAPSASVPKTVKIKPVLKPVNGHVPEPDSITNHSSSSSGPKLIVKFNFPIARLKRSPSMKAKKVKTLKLTGEDSQTPISSHVSVHENFEFHEELSNGEARLTNGLEMDDISTEEKDHLPTGDTPTL